MATAEAVAVPPWSEQAELATLGAMLWGFADDVLASGITAAAFYRRSHGQVFAVIERMVGEGVPVDQVTLLGRLDPALRVVAATAGSAVPVARNGRHYAAQLLDLAERRARIAALESLLAVEWDRGSRVEDRATLAALLGVAG